MYSATSNSKALIGRTEALKIEALAGLSSFDFKGSSWFDRSN